MALVLVNGEGERGRKGGGKRGFCTFEGKLFALASKTGSRNGSFFVFRESRLYLEPAKEGEREKKRGHG